MRLASCIAPALIAAASPALATSTIHCTAPGRAGVELYLSVGNGPPPEGGVTQVRILEGRRETVTGYDRGGPRLERTHVDPRALRFDVTISGQRLARLDARVGRGSAYLGTLLLRGRSGPVRCLWDEDE
jgi:hypothetical protein